MGYPPAVSDFEAYFSREFIYGTGKDTVTSADIQRALNEAPALFNPALWVDTTEMTTAYLYLSAHLMVRNIQAAGGLSSVPRSRGVDSRGSGATESKGAGSVQVSYAVPDFVRQSPILSQFMQTDFGQRYLQMLTPRLVGAVGIASSRCDSGLAGKLQPFVITTTTLPGGTHAVPYSQTIAVSGGLGPASFAVVTGSLPSGITLNVNTGVISGTAVGAGTSFFGIRATDARGATAIMNYQLVMA